MAGTRTAIAIIVVVDGISRRRSFRRCSGRGFMMGSRGLGGILRTIGGPMSIIGTSIGIRGLAGRTGMLIGRGFGVGMTWGFGT